MAERCIDTLLFGHVCDDCHGGLIIKSIEQVIIFLSAGVILAATAFMIYEGVKIMTAKDDSAKLAQAKRRIFQIVIGIVVYVFMFLIADFLVPSGIVRTAVTGDSPTCPKTPSIGGGDPSTGDDPEAGSMSDVIAMVAATMSWPIQSWQNGYDPFFDPNADGSGKVYYGTRSARSYGGPDTIGKCWYSGGSEWRDYTKQLRSGGIKDLCANTKEGGAGRGRVTYDVFNAIQNNAVYQNAYASCDRFVSTVLYSVKLGTDSAGNKFPRTGPSGMKAWFDKSPDWQEVSNRGTATDLQPGDVFAAEKVGETFGHVAIYVGKYGYTATDGANQNLAEASSGGRYPRLTRYINAGGAYLCSGGTMLCACNKNQPYHIYRYIGADSGVKNPWTDNFQKNEAGKWVGK
jgi:hypothetical protein